MATLAENLRSKFLATDAIASRVQSRMFQDVPQTNQPRPFIFFRRSSTNHERTLGESQGETPFSHTFDVELVGDRESDAELLVDAVRTLDGFTGTAGAGTVKRLFIEDQTDDYEPVNSGDGRFIKSLRMEVYP